MTVQELYTFFDEKIPSALSCEWDNDGLMCCPDPDAQVKKVLIALDITAAVAEKAIAEGYDVILSHHPLIFRPLKALHMGDPVSRKVVRLLCSGVAAMSFHTRLDAVAGGVNDVLAEALGLQQVEPFGPNGETIGRIGVLPSAMSLREFADLVKTKTGAPCVQISSANRPVSRVAVLGGSGSDDVSVAAACGADTFLSGELKHNYLTDAPDCGMNLVAAGHFHTENPVCEKLREWVLEADATIAVDVIDSNPVEAV